VFLLYLVAVTAAPEVKSSADFPSIVTSVFVGQLVNSIQCLSCNKVIFTHSAKNTLIRFGLIWLWTEIHIQKFLSWTPVTL